MKELSEIIKITPVLGSAPSTDTFRSIKPFSLEATAKSTEQGDFYEVEKTIDAELPENPDFTIGRFFAILEFSTTRGEKIKIGSYSIPAVVTVTPMLNSVSIDISCICRTNPLL